MKTLLSIFLTLSVLCVRADAWDNLTLEQAKAVKAYVEEHPFIFDFCDCCGNSVDVYLLKVESAEIVPCEWDKEQYSVLTQSKRIAKMQWASIGIDDYHTNLADEVVEHTIYMNYTFGFDPCMKWAVPFHKLVDYPNDGPICIGATNFPDPTLSGVKIEDEDYLEWYKKAFRNQN